MNEKLELIIEESLQLELNVSELYMVFHAAFPEDGAFWWGLLLEEENHASLVRSIKESFLPESDFLNEMFFLSYEELKKANTKLRSLIREFRDNAPSREDAFNIALKIEQSAGEVHFQEFIDKKEKSKIGKIFEQLNQGDKDHAKRIRSYMEAHGIKVKV
jgi:hypothetical protein